MGLHDVLGAGMSLSESEIDWTVLRVKPMACGRMWWSFVGTGMKHDVLRAVGFCQQHCQERGPASVGRSLRKSRIHGAPALAGTHPEDSPASSRCRVGPKVRVLLSPSVFLIFVTLDFPVSGQVPAHGLSLSFS